MGVIKWVIRLIVVLAVIFVGGAFLLPKETSVARTVTMNAAPEVIFPYIANLRANPALTFHRIKSLPQSRDQSLLCQNRRPQLMYQQAHLFERLLNNFPDSC